MNISLSTFAPENLVSRHEFGSPVPRQPAHLHTQAELGAYLWDSSRVPRRRPFIYLKPPYANGSVPSLSGHAIAYRWRSLPRVRRHMTSKPQGSSERELPWQITVFIFYFFLSPPMDITITILTIVTRIFPSLPGSRLTIFYRDASSAINNSSTNG